MKTIQIRVPDTFDIKKPCKTCFNVRCANSKIDFPCPLANAIEVKDGGEAGLREAHCPTCRGEIKSTERRPDGDSVCVNGHKHKTKEFFIYSPSTPAPVASQGLVEELRVKIAEQKSAKHDYVLCGHIEEILSRFKPSSEEGLRDGIEVMLKHYKENGVQEVGLDVIGKIVELSHPADKVEEPLAVLADRKGWDNTKAKFYKGLRIGHSQSVFISIYGKGRNASATNQFWGATYAECEAKARAYLESLPDKEGV
jgi:hypothetical protein